MKHYFKLLLTALVSIAALGASAQITYSIPNTAISSCLGSDAYIMVSIFNGTGPYELTYSDGTTTSISTSSNTYFMLDVQATTTGMLTYDLISLQDANGQAVTINQPITIDVLPLPNVQAIVTQDECGVTICGSGAMTYTISGISGGLSTGFCQPFIPPSGTGSYIVTGVGLNGCVNSDTAIVTFASVPPILNQPVASIDSAYCNDGSISLSLQNQAPFSVTWNNLGNTSPFLTGLSSGYYSATITDTNGCVFNTTYFVPQGQMTCGIVSGSVYYDLDGSCSLTSGDQQSPNKLIVANPGNFIAFSNGAGQYELHLYPGTYTIQEVIGFPNMAPVCNAVQTVAVSAGQTVEDINFMDTISGEIDLEGFMYMSDVRPGFQFHFYPRIKNVLPVNDFPDVAAWFVIPPDVTFNGWNYVHTISNDTVYFSASASASMYMEPVFFHAANVQLGDTVTFCMGIEHHLMENNLMNNEKCVSTIAIGSYDPNDKTTFVGNHPTNGTIHLEDQVLDYVIRFQNTGTADAINVSILDTIQETLEISSFELVNTSHGCNTILLPGNTLKFDFPFIHLPDSTTDEPGSHGFIHYRIRQKPSNALGTSIRNTAYIYFDFNEAVITNTTSDLIVEPSGLDEFGLEKVQLYPNPTGGKMTVRTGSELKSVTLYTMNGQQLEHLSPKEKQLVIDLSTYDQGIYLLRVETTNGVALHKIQKH